VKIMRDHIAHRIDHFARDPGKEFADGRKEFAEWFFEELAVLLRENEHSTDLQCVAPRKFDVHPFCYF